MAFPCAVHLLLIPLQPPWTTEEGTKLNRDAEVKPCLCGNQQHLCHRAGRCQISWLCFWELKMVAEVCSETPRSLSPLLPPSFLPLPPSLSLLAPQSCWILSPWSWAPASSPLPGAGCCGGGHAGSLHPSSPPPRLCHLPGRTVLVVPGPALLPGGLPAGSPPKPACSLL